MRNINREAIVVLSGGQDSVTCLALAVKTHGAQNVAAIAFNYGQRHAVELQCASEASTALGVPLTVVKIPLLDSASALITGNGGDVSQAHPDNPNLPASFVRNRNALFLTYAHGYAQDVKASELYTGVCQTDYSGYPDCRRDFIDALEGALNRGSESAITITTPLMNSTKADTFALAADLGALDLVLEHSHTCYNGDRTHRHAWGYGCGDCPACRLRARGWDEFASLPLYASLTNPSATQESQA